MTLLVVDENNEVKVNAPWILLIPEFRALFESRSRTAWDRNTYAKKVLAFIYFYKDFYSPLRDWEDELRFKESLKYTEVAEQDVKDEKVVAAVAKYKFLQYNACRAIKTYEASLVGLTAMDTYLKTIDFNARDKQGKLLYTPNQYAANLALTEKAYDTLDKLANRVVRQLEQHSGIRGKGVMGDSEIKAANLSGSAMEQLPWDEAVITPDDRTQWTEITGLLDKLKDDKDDKDDVA